MDIKSIIKQSNIEHKQKVNSEVRAIPKKTSASDALKLLDMTTLQKGDTLKGELVGTQQGLSTILTDKGAFSGQISESVNLLRGNVYDFLVTENKGNTVSLHVQNLDPKEAFTNKISSTLLELGLADDERNQIVAKALIEHQMPVNKDTMQLVKNGMYRFENSNAPEGAVNKAILLAKNDLPINNETVATLNNINSKSSSISESLSTVLNQINNLPDGELKESLGVILKDLVKYTNADTSSTTSVYTKNSAPTNNITVNDTVQQIQGKSNEIPLKVEQNNLLEKDVVSKENTTDIIQDDKNLNLSSKNISDQSQGKDFLQNLKRNPLKDFETNTNVKDELLEKIVTKEKPQGEDNQFNSLIKDNLVKEKFSNVVKEEFSKLQESVEKAIKTLSNNNSEDASNIKEGLKVISTKLDMFNDVKNTTFFQFPLTMNDQQREVSLKVFKDKKSKKSDSDPISAIVSLYTENMGLFGTYVQKDKKNLTLQFRLESNEVEQVVRKNINKLTTILQPLGYKVNNITFKTTDDINNIELIEMDILEVGTEEALKDPLISLDMKG
ncbi:MAG: hypothetical protein ACK5LV_08040 [Lachnospirales bacterium]